MQMALDHFSAVVEGSRGVEHGSRALGDGRAVAVPSRGAV